MSQAEESLSLRVYGVISLCAAKAASVCIKKFSESTFSVLVLARNLARLNSESSAIVLKNTSPGQSWNACSKHQSVRARAQPCFTQL